MQNEIDRFNDIGIMDIERMLEIMGQSWNRDKIVFETDYTKQMETVSYETCNDINIGISLKLL